MRCTGEIERRHDLRRVEDSPLQRSDFREARPGKPDRHVARAEHRRIARRPVVVGVQPDGIVVGVVAVEERHPVGAIGGIVEGDQGLALDIRDAAKIGVIIGIGLLIDFTPGIPSSEVVNG